MKRRSNCIAALIVGWSWFAAAAMGAADPGLKLTLESADGKITDSRVARLPAICVPGKLAASPFLSGPRFRATWSGEINLKLRDEFTFTAQGRGEVELTLAGEQILLASGDDLSKPTSKPAKLKKGANQIVVKYTAPADGDAVLRLYWTPKKSFLQPIPPTLLTHQTDDALAQSVLVREGRTLFATLRCGKCHLADPKQTLAMPELAMDAPNLDDAGSRLNAGWIAKWIENPRSIRPDASMPRVPNDAAAVRDIAAYLASPKQPAALAAPADSGKADEGARLFATLGCIVCHTTPDAPADANRTPLDYVKAKWKPATLREYLLEPERHYQWTRMPNFKLTSDEASALNDFLLARAPDPVPTDAAAGDPKHGEKLFASSGCANCHAPDRQTSLRAPSLSALKSRGAWDRGCMSQKVDPFGHSPDFGLSDQQRNAIRAFGQTDLSSLSRDAAPEFAERQITMLRCTACHTRDAQQDLWSTLSDEVNALAPPVADPKSDADQTRPTLTWVGEKLRPDWITQFISGKLDYKPRPWLPARMPAFASRAKLLADGLSLEHGYPLPISDEPPADPELAKIGMKLIGRNGGFSCNQCHAINKSPALVPFDSPAPNFMYVTERLRKDYYHRWMRNPQAFQPGTKMPTFPDSNGKTSFKDILDGDADKQFEAIWQYARGGRSILPPE
jgi:mono/diheme cytochrome c family protein